MTDFLPFAKPSITEAEISEVVHTLRSGWLTTGPQTKRFENDFAKYLQRSNAIAVNSATAGLHLALEAVGVKEGDVVITSVYTFTASAEVIRYLGATPIFIDIDPITKNMDVHLLAKALEKYQYLVKAIIPVHFAGFPCDMDEILKLSKQYNVVVIEDAAHSLPTTYKGKLIGSFGDITVFSFYATKTLATGEGGMVVTDNDAWAKRIKTMRLHGINRDVFDRYSSKTPSWYYEVVAPGFKYNMTDVAASLGIHQLLRLNEMQKSREIIAFKYLDELSKTHLELPFFDKNETHSWHLFTVELPINFHLSRDIVIEKITALGIGLSVHFIPLHRQPYWKNLSSLTDDDFPIATSKFLRTFSLPIYPSMTESDIQRVIDAVVQIVGIK